MTETVHELAELANDARPPVGHYRGKSGTIYRVMHDGSIYKQETRMVRNANNQRVEVPHRLVKVLDRPKRRKHALVDE